MHNTKQPNRVRIQEDEERQLHNLDDESDNNSIGRYIAV